MAKERVLTTMTSRPRRCTRTKAARHRPPLTACLLIKEWQALDSYDMSWETGSDGTTVTEGEWWGPCRFCVQYAIPEPITLYLDGVTRQFLRRDRAGQIDAYVCPTCEQAYHVRCDHIWWTKYGVTSYVGHKKCAWWEDKVYCRECRWQKVKAAPGSNINPLADNHDARALKFE
jgi:hypothetical protein